MSLLEKIINVYQNITPFQTGLILSLVAIYIFWLYWIDKDVPPGPLGLPLLGYWPFISNTACHLQLRDLSKKYGDVYSFRVTGKLLINLGSLKAMREAHLTKSECFARRYSEDSILVYLFNVGVAFINGEPWKVLRKFFLSKFKEYGFNAVKENSAGSITDMLKETVEELRDLNGSPVDISDIVTMKCLRILRRIMFNDQCLNDEELKEISDLYGEIIKGMSSKNLMLIGPIAKYLVFPFKPWMWTIKRCVKRIDDIMTNVIYKYMCEYNESQVSNVVDCYLKERDERRKKGDPTAACFTDKSLISSMGMFMTDGPLTVSALIGNFLATLCEYPDEQEKIYQEILEVIGPDRLPSLDDKANMPYTNAFMNEVSRFTDFFPMLPSLECTKETTVYGYRIPKGAITLLNMYAANQNPKDFENPDHFNPSRYLSSPNKPKTELPVMFGIGKRSCLGEGFSMIQTFLFMTTILQNFRLAFPEKEKGSSLFFAEERVKICAHLRT